MGYIQTRGLLFESICSIFLEKADFSIIDSSQSPNYELDRVKGSYKIKGRGDWHQIDLPYDYNYKLAMLNPIRIIGEVKFYGGTKKVGLSEMRSFSMACLDIHQNYIVQDNTRNNIERTLDQALFISANGFSVHAQNFAYAHNVKLIDASKNSVLAPTLRKIDGLATKLESLISSNEMKRELISHIQQSLRSNVQSNDLSIFVSLINDCLW